MSPPGQRILLSWGRAVRLRASVTRGLLCLSGSPAIAGSAPTRCIGSSTVRSSVWSLHSGTVGVHILKAAASLIAAAAASHLASAAASPLASVQAW